MQISFPNEERFSAENFGNTPIWVIEQALFYLNRFELEKASMLATPIASLGMSYCIHKGVKNPDPAWFNPFESKLFKQTASEIVDPRAAKTFLDLAASAKLPSWVGQYVDIQLIRAASTNY